MRKSIKISKGRQPWLFKFEVFTCLSSFILRVYLPLYKK